MVRRWGVGIAIISRIVLLFILIIIIQYFKNSFLEIHLIGIIDSSLNLPPYGALLRAGIQTGL